LFTKILIFFRKIKRNERKLHNEQIIIMMSELVEMLAKHCPPPCPKGGGNIKTENNSIIGLLTRTCCRDTCKLHSWPHDGTSCKDKSQGPNPLYCLQEGIGHGDSPIRFSVT